MNYFFRSVHDAIILVFSVRSALVSEHLCLSIIWALGAHLPDTLSNDNNVVVIAPT